MNDTEKLLADAVEIIGNLVLNQLISDTDAEQEALDWYYALPPKTV